MEPILLHKTACSQCVCGNGMGREEGSVCACVQIIQIYKVLFYNMITQFFFCLLLLAIVTTIVVSNYTSF